MVANLISLAAGASGLLLASVWQGLALAGCVALCLRMIPRISAAARSVVWLAVFVLVGVLDVVAVPGTGVAGEGGGVHLDARWGIGLAVVWAVISSVRGLRLVAGAVRLAGVAQRAVPVAGQGTAVGWRVPVICTSSEVERPGVVGFFAPRILLPAGLCERLSAAELEAVVLHEREHLRRGDDWTNLLQKMGVAMMPLNPVLAWVERRLCLERELACDDHVVRRTRARKAYAACLARLAEEAMVRRPLALALGAVGRGSELAERVHRILAKPEAVLGRRAAAGVTGVLLAGLVAGGVELARFPRLVSFAPRDMGMRADAAPLMSAPGTPMVFGARLVRTAARMDAPPATRSARVRTARTRLAVGQRARVAKPYSGAAATVRRRREGWIVMTGWTVESAGQPALLSVGLAVPDSLRVSSSSYASVPVGNGWLVFQL